MSFARRLRLAFWAQALAISALFSLFAMAFAYTVEDRFLERMLEQEGARLQAGRAQSGHWPAPAAPHFQLLMDPAALPDGLAAQLAAKPQRREFSGAADRHYHLLRLTHAGQSAWLVAEVSELLVVRPQREGLLRWLAGWALGVTVLALLVGHALARHLAAPLQHLAQQLGAGHPQQLPQRLAQGLRSDEVGRLAAAIDALHVRTQAFIEREQAFTRDASHELRTPLAVLKLGLAGPPDAAQLTRLRAAVAQLEQTLDSLLWLARESHAQPASAPTLLLPLVEQWALANEAALQGRSLQIDLPRDAALALPEPVLRLVLANLLGNALVHGDTQGQGEIALQREADGALLISNPSPPPPAGLGQPFVKGGASAGFGLGLAIVQRLLERQGGRLALAHQDGVTRVRVWAGAQTPHSGAPHPGV